MARRFLVLVLAACDAPVPPVEPAPPHWVYAPAPSGWPLGDVSGSIGRAQAPQPVISLGITGTQRVPLRLPTAWQVPGDGVARAVIYGLEGARAAIELVDIDAGTVRWRDAGACTGPVVGVTEDAIVCAGADGVRGVTLDGAQAWRTDMPFVAMTDDRVVVGPTGLAVILDAKTGDEISRVTLPPRIVAETIVASCGDAGRELFAATTERMLVRIADVKGKPATTWVAQLGTFEAIDACDGDHVIVQADGVLRSYVRATGAPRALVPEVRGWWPARDGSDRIEIATLGGIARWARDLVTSEPVMDLAAGELLAQRGDRRLVRASPATAVLLDRRGVAAYLPLAQRGAALGDQAIVAASWTGSPASTVARIAIPARYRRQLRLPAPRRGVGVTAELRDLPDEHALALDGALAKPDTGTHGTGAVALDPVAPQVVYVAAYEQLPDDDTPSPLAAVDLVTKAWTWQRSDGCGGGSVVGVAAARTIVACGTQGVRPGTGAVRATTREGEPRWEWEGDGLDALAAAGDLVLVRSGDRAYVLDADTGRPRLQLASDDGGAVRAALVDDATWGMLVIGAERGRLVARAAALDMVPVWSLAVDGVVRGISAAGDGVLVELEDGDAVRVLAGDATVIGVPGLGLDWLASGDLLAGATAGGPLYGAPLPAPPVQLPRRRRVINRPVATDDPERPKLWDPRPLPPIAAPSWQVTLYDLTGALRARFDYGVDAPQRWSPRGPAGSPVLVRYGAAGALVIDPRTGDPLRRVSLPEAALVFSTIVDGSPVAGAVLSKPLRVVLF